eukprot:CAMPEP_0113937410 /NCGR_PEP_ID=MMETSP1339-20121228/4036_1 /TAXON_ID=94617 /ORGANISM="Fibrocapsa japonica" /LENGTH=166 /DNA_ID=CAMNT_0000940161 /DNA_START=223 /DNA_END=720 /DNA_ORIENTATION=+ /assembly_acc=CAM_ASM_000762
MDASLLSTVSMFDPAALYNIALQKYGLVTDVATSGSLYAVADSVAQNIERVETAGGDKDEEVQESNSSQAIEPQQWFDLSRLSRFIIIGVTDGAFAHFWYEAMGSLFPTATPIMVAEQVLLDQVFYGGSFTIYYLVLTTLLDGGSFPQAIKRVKRDFWTLIFASQW